MSIDNTILEFKLPTSSSSQTSSSPSTRNILITNLISTPTTTSSIKVNVKELNLKIYNEIIVSWSIVINEETTITDWIGIYKIDG